MCGIVGYHGDSEAQEKLFRGLKKLEYRGYDSAGIATIGNPSIKTDKGVGTVDEAIEKDLDGTSGIGHTRWATHGAANEKNAHPHTDCENSIAVVHNGIIRNHSELREELSDHEFRSDTDTEIIPHLLEEELERKPLREAAESVIERLEGSYAVLVALETGEMAAFKQNSPLALGEKDGEVFIASDVTPFISEIDRAHFMRDGEIAMIDNGFEIFHEGEKTEKKPEEIEWDEEETGKGDHEHYMKKEILEQPTTVKKASYQDRNDMEKAADMIEEAEKVYITGCGTSGIASALAAKYIPADVDVELSHELEYRTEEIDDEDLVIAVSQSGETADLLAVLKNTDASVLGVVNTVGSTIDRKADHTLYLNAGPEIGVASTKAFTAQLAVLKLLGYTLEGKLKEGRKTLIETAEKIEKVIEENEEEILDISEYLSEKDDAYFIGRHRGFEVARESALKLKELSYIHAEAFPGGEFKHGTLALVEDGTPVIGFLKDRTREELLSNIAEARGRGADIILTGDEKPEGVDYFIEIPEDENREILEVVPFQMIAYTTSRLKGNNPDKPRNLAKSITVK